VVELFPALRSPRGKAVLHIGEETLHDGELADRCVAHARKLAAAGVGAGERVAVWTEPTMDAVVALVGNVLAGAVTVPLAPQLGAAEREHILRDAAPRAIVEDGEVWQVNGPAGEALADAVLVLYTSGTTGAPKGAVITPANVAACLDALAQAWAWTEADTIVHALPLFHVHGLVLGLFGALRTGGALRWVPKFAPGELAGALAEEAERGQAVLFAVPTMFHRLAEAAEADGGIGRALGAARLLVSGSAPLSLREHARIERASGTRVIERYGLTETLILTAVRHDDPPCPGSVGRPLDGVELRLVDDARRHVEAAGAIGEVAVRGPSVFAGYLGRPGATAAVRDEDGWFYTGDLATRDEPGSLRIVGRRATDLIKTGGFKVGAGEIEAALLEHPGVREVAVIGAPDDDLGERIVAFVVAAEGAPPSADALIAHVGAQLARHKRPRVVHFVESLPRNAMGKVLKAKLR
jgi:malonyl-CoA/methylmalonyl-CoA synthetase